MRADDSSQNKEPTLVWLDMGLYKSVQTLFSRPLIPRQYLGPFHIPVVLCTLQCLGATIESSGLDVAWSELGLYSSVTVVQICTKW